MLFEVHINIKIWCGIHVSQIKVVNRKNVNNFVTEDAADLLVETLVKFIQRVFVYDIKYVAVNLNLWQ